LPKIGFPPSWAHELLRILPPYPAGARIIKLQETFHASHLDRAPCGNAFVVTVMESFVSRFKNALVLIAILLAQTIALATQIRRPADPLHPDSANVRLARLWALASIAPFEKLSTGTGHDIRHAWTDYVDLRHVRQRNQDLEYQIAQLRLERAAVAQDALEGQRLARLLAFRQTYIARTVAAQVIGTSGSDQGQILTLNKGSDAGLKPDMAVITPDGVVGKLRDVFPGTSELQLLSDPLSGAGVILQSTRIRAIVRGSRQGRIEIDNLTADSRIKPGETVLTSGGDQVFPRGLPVGTIVSIAPDPQHQPYTSIVLKPAADLNRLDEVLVVTGLSDTLPAASEAELTSDAARHAADIPAERLPGLNETTGPTAPDAPPGAAAPTPAPPAENSKELAPRPSPALHPDRYSPGEAPPADEMTPGLPSPRPPMTR
jgi:rod shape-determining protein MreC